MAPQKKEKKTAKQAIQSDNTSYSAADISVLEGLDPVRKRPGMYIGSTGPTGLHHLVWEIFDNSRDEAMAGHCDEVEITILPDNLIRVVDNGRGIPVDKHPKTKVSALETIMTTLHAGGKFGGGGYKVSGGLHGVGASVVNALSTYVKVEVHRDGGMFVQEYEQGKKIADVKQVGKSDKTGTIVTFKPDPSIFSETEYVFKTLTTHLRQQAYLIRGLRIRVIDAREANAKVPLPVFKKSDEAYWFTELGIDAPSQSYYFEGGLKSLVTFYNQGQKVVHSSIFYVEKELDKVHVEVALQYIDDISVRVVPFANNTYNSEGGMHITGFKTALTRTINNYAKKNELVNEKDGAFSGEDVLEGITVVVSVKLEEIQFEGQTKSKLGSPEARGAVDTVFADAFNMFLEENPDEARQIINKSILALRARKAAKAAKDSVLRKGALDGMTLPGKLADCTTKNADDAEIFIVEGDSAGGSAKQGRDRATQAILPLRGKILNVERARLDKMLESKEVRALVIAMGTAIGETFDLSGIRYKKIIIATDADVDGAHIGTLLLTLFYRYFKPVIEAGYLYIAQPPLYKITEGKTINYAYTDEEKFKLVGDAEPEDTEEEGESTEPENEASPEKVKVKKIKIQRYKGLGEMNPEELWETTMDPNNRVLKQVTIVDAQEADKTFDTLMGSEVAPRKSFIQSNAKLAEIDV
jgi:DNA gyrase subunit B